MTRGDFRFWKDDQGREKKESPVIWDPEWNMYKTYPWWIAKRNDMDLVCDAICGSIDDRDNTTYYGAWNIVLQHFFENMPFTKFGIIVTYTGKREWRDATRRVAKKWGIPMLDMRGDPALPCIFGKEEELGMDPDLMAKRKEQFILCEENKHPSLKAHKFQSTFIENFLRNL